MLKEGFSDDKVLQTMIDDMKRTTKVQRDIKVADIFDLSFVKKANEEIKSKRLEAIKLFFAPWRHVGATDIQSGRMPCALQNC